MTKVLGSTFQCQCEMYSNETLSGRNGFSFSFSPLSSKSKRFLHVCKYRNPINNTFTFTIIIFIDENRIVHSCYDLQTTPRGYCVIIDNMENNTFGGDKNNEKLTRCLEERLAFHVEHFTRLNTISIHRLLEKLSKVNHNDYSCLMVIVLGRGRNHFLYGYDNEVIGFNEIMSYFLPEMCTTLRGKPKLFLFQTFGEESESIRSRPQSPYPELTDSYQVHCNSIPSTYTIHVLHACCNAAKHNSDIS